MGGCGAILEDFFEGVIGLEGSTRMDKNGNFSIQEKALGGLRVQIKKTKVPTKLGHIVVGPERGTWDRTNQKFMEKSKHPTSRQVLGRKMNFLENVQIPK